MTHGPQPKNKEVSQRRQSFLAILAAAATLLSAAPILAASPPAGADAWLTASLAGAPSRASAINFIALNQSSSIWATPPGSLADANGCNANFTGPWTGGAGLIADPSLLADSGQPVSFVLTVEPPASLAPAANPDAIPVIAHPPTPASPASPEPAAGFCPGRRPSTPQAFPVAFSPSDRDGDTCYRDSAKSTGYVPKAQADICKWSCDEKPQPQTFCAAFVPAARIQLALARLDPQPHNLTVCQVATAGKERAAATPPMAGSCPAPHVEQTSGESTQGFCSAPLASSTHEFKPLLATITPQICAIAICGPHDPGETRPAPPPTAAIPRFETASTTFTPPAAITLTSFNPAFQPDAAANSYDCATPWTFTPTFNQASWVHPVPEPSTWILMLLGLTALAAHRRHAKNSSKPR